MPYTTNLKKPCKDCPYRKGQIVNFETLQVEKEWFDDNEIQHSCHTTTKYYTIYPDELLGCIGSKMFAEKMNNNTRLDVDYSEIKDFVEMS